jgi:hypothetical protein
MDTGLSKTMTIWGNLENLSFLNKAILLLNHELF